MINIEPSQLPKQGTNDILYFCYNKQSPSKESETTVWQLTQENFLYWADVANSLSKFREVQDFDGLKLTNSGNWDSIQLYISMQLQEQDSSHLLRGIRYEKGKKTNESQIWIASY